MFRRAATALVLLSQLCNFVEAATYSYTLTRYRDQVTGFCIDGASRPVDIDTATAFLIGNFHSISGHGRLCVNKPQAVYVNNISDPVNAFTYQSSLPLTLATSSFTAPVWSADPGDTVSFTAVNALPNRPLSVDGTPVPIELMPPVGSTPSTQSLPLQPASSFNITAVDMLPTAQAYMATCLKDNKGKETQGAVLIQNDNSDPDGVTWDVGYLMFKRQKDDSISGILFVASYYQPVTTGQRRLLSLRGATQRQLLSYYYYGGSDSSGGRTCTVTCVLISPTPPGCVIGSPTYPSCKYSCRCK